MNNSNFLPSISIIIPVFKVKDYIIDCVQSVVNQDYNGEIECILIDDRGEDGSIELCEQFIAEQTSKIKFKILRNEKNLRQSTSRNRGMKIAKGDYIYFLDSDDWIIPSTISMMVETLSRYPNSEIVQAGITRTNPSSFPWLDCESWKDKEIEYSDNREWIVNTCAARMSMIPMTPVSKLMSRQFIEKHQMAFAEGFYYEDEVWLVLIAKHLTSIAFCHTNPYYYRIHNNSTVGGSTKRWNDLVKMWDEIFKLFDENFCPKSIVYQIERDTTILYHHYKDKHARSLLIKVKLALLKYADMKRKIHIIIWIMRYYHQSIL